MTPELEAKLQGLEEQLAADPGSESPREEILFEYLGAGLAGEPRRILHAVEYVLWLSAAPPGVVSHLEARVLRVDNGNPRVLRWRAGNQDRPDWDCDQRGAR